MASRRIILAVVALWVCVLPASATVFINEIFMNPPGGQDETTEYVELMGTPGKKLDGYGLAYISGCLEKYYPLDSIPPFPGCIPEIDEFMSLDGLELGRNGLLAITLGAASFYPTVLDDTAIRPSWASIWNGSIEDVSRLENDGSITVMLVRNRRGRTEADPTNPAGLLWGKDVFMDIELISPVEDPQSGEMVDQFGDGNIDRGLPNGLGGNTRDLFGVTTPEDITDDLEIVDEVSWEHERGWEYEIDDRNVDVGSTHPGLPQRNVHALDDPQGFNPDVISRVDYRTKGEGWTPAAGAIGDMDNGANWQDTATEQWVRGESTFSLGGGGIEFFYDHAVNANPDSIQPYMTNVPTWLNDGIGDDYDFSQQFTYGIQAGRVNHLAVPFIPGDADRDGDADVDDIEKIRSVFGDDDWLFPNFGNDALNGDDGDPAAQARPWDVDATGANGIGPGDLQWTLNFQGDTTGHIVGVQYDSEVPASDGVVIQSNEGVTCEVTASVQAGKDGPAGSLSVGSVIELTVSVEITLGAVLDSGAENGVMQFAHDLFIDTADVVRVVAVEPLGAFATTREEAQVIGEEGANGGARFINGFTMSFDQGVAGPALAYRVTLEAVGLGKALVTVSPASLDRIAADTPFGVKLGHTDHQGDPGSAVYPDAIAIEVATALGNCDGDSEVTLVDYACFYDCALSIEKGEQCGSFDFNGDQSIDLLDFGRFQAAFGSN